MITQCIHATKAPVTGAFVEWTHWDLHVLTMMAVPLPRVPRGSWRWWAPVPCSRRAILGPWACRRPPSHPASPRRPSSDPGSTACRCPQVVVVSTRSLQPLSAALLFVFHRTVERSSLTLAFAPARLPPCRWDASRTASPWARGRGPLHGPSWTGQ